MTVSNGEMLFDAVPSALKHLQHHEHKDKKRDGLRAQLNQDDQELRERIGELTAEEGRLAREYQKSGYTPFKEDANGKRVAVDWAAPIRDERARCKAGIEANAFARKKIGRNVTEDLKAFCASTKRAWREVEMPRVADDRAPLEIIRERGGELVAILQEEREVQDANRTDPEIEKMIRAEYARRKLLGVPKFGDLKMGGSFRFNGQFTPANPGARLQFPTVGATGQGSVESVVVEVDDALNFAIWVDDDEKILAKLLKAARDSNASKLQISEADKTKMLREIAVRKLAAQRHLEAGYRHAEAQGVEVKRRELPPEVLLWIESDTSAPATPTKAKATPAPVNEEIDVPDFEDEAADA
jgi:hypothetical protein